MRFGDRIDSGGGGAAGNGGGGACLVGLDAHASVVVYHALYGNQHPAGHGLTSLEGRGEWCETEQREGVPARLARCQKERTVLQERSRPRGIGAEGCQVRNARRLTWADGLQTRCGACQASHPSNSRLVLACLFLLQLLHERRVHPPPLTPPRLSTDDSNPQPWPSSSVEPRPLRQEALAQMHGPLLFWRLALLAATSGRPRPHRWQHRGYGTAIVARDGWCWCPTAGRRR